MGGFQADPATAALVKALPQELLNTLPAGMPPKGVIPNLAHPQWRVPEILGVGIPFLVIATCMYMIRLYMKIRVLKKWQWADSKQFYREARVDRLTIVATITLGYFTSLTFFIIMAWGSIVGPIGKHGYEIPIANAISVGGFASIVCGTFLPLPALGFIKATLFLQYLKLFSHIKWMKIAILAGLAVNIIFYATMTTIYVALMAQRPGEAIVDTLFSVHFNMVNDLFLPPGIVGVSLDWYLLILPIPAVLRLNMSPLRKLGVLSIFMTGGLAAIAAIVSLYNRSQLNVIIEDASWNVVTVVIWVFIELFCGIIAACMPTLHLYWNRHERLVKLSSKFKGTMKTVLGMSSSEKSSKANRNAQHRGSDEKAVQQKDSDFSTSSSNGILVTQEYGVARHYSRSETEFPRNTSVLYLDNDLEAQFQASIGRLETSSRTQSTGGEIVKNEF